MKSITIQESIETLRNAQYRLHCFHDGLQTKAHELDSPFVMLVADEIDELSRLIDQATTNITGELITPVKIHTAIK